MSELTPAEYQYRYTDLLGERVGGKALACSDEWFAACANLVRHEDPVFREGHFVATGQWMDGWESRRSFGRSARRNSGLDHDWCRLRLGIPGRLHGVDIETTHFRGNAPEHASLEGSWAPGDIDDATQWFTLLPKRATRAHAHNVFAVAADQPCTHLRLKIFPDGGVARLRAWGSAAYLPENTLPGELVDLASVLVGGRGMQCSDRFYSSPSNMLMPYPGVNMGDGWETRRRRDTGNDWCIVRLGLSGSIRKVLVDTAHFKGNYPDSFSLEAVHSQREDLAAADIAWQAVIAQTPLQADHAQVYIQEIQAAPEQKFTHVRLNIFPDGGISRLRVFGFPERDSGA